MKLVVKKKIVNSPDNIELSTNHQKLTNATIETIAKKLQNFLPFFAELLRFLRIFSGFLADAVRHFEAPKSAQTGQNTLGRHKGAYNPPNSVCGESFGIKQIII